MNMIDNSQRTAAKIAGVTGLLAVAIVVFGNYVLLSPLIVPRDAAETARNIMAHETQARVALICFLLYSANVVVLLTALYVILRPVDRILALIGALFRLVFAVLWLLATLNLLRLAATARNRTLPSSIPTGPLTSLGQAADRGKFRRLLCRSAIFRIGRDHLRVPMAQVGIHSKNAGCFRCDFIGMVRDLRLYFPGFPKLQ